jgi:hypothetical protein
MGYPHNPALARSIGLEGQANRRSTIVNSFHIHDSITNGGLPSSPLGRWSNTARKV